MAKRGGAKRVERTTADLLRELVGQHDLLREYSARAFEQNDERFLGEVAGKLRLLVLRLPKNRPLLLDLMAKLGSKTKVHIDSPRGQQVLTIDEYLDLLALAIRTPTGAMARFTNREFAAALAQQHGSSHQDWHHDPGLAASRMAPIFIGGLRAHARVLQAIARTVLSVGDAFLAEVGVFPAKAPLTPEDPDGGAAAP